MIIIGLICIGGMIYTFIAVLGLIFGGIFSYNNKRKRQSSQRPSQIRALNKQTQMLREQNQRIEAELRKANERDE